MAGAWGVFFLSSAPCNCYRPWREIFPRRNAHASFSRLSPDKPRDHPSPRPCDDARVSYLFGLYPHTGAGCPFPAFSRPALENFVCGLPSSAANGFLTFPQLQGGFTPLPPLPSLLSAGHGFLAIQDGRNSSPSHLRDVVFFLIWVQVTVQPLPPTGLFSFWSRISWEKNALIGGEPFVEGDPRYGESPQLS